MIDLFDYGIDKIDFTTHLPKPIIKEYDGIQVVRDDLIEGGTKRRAFTTWVGNQRLQYRKVKDTG